MWVRVAARPAAAASRGLRVLTCKWVAFSPTSIILTCERHMKWLHIRWGSERLCKRRKRSRLRIHRGKLFKSLSIRSGGPYGHCCMSAGGAVALPGPPRVHPAFEHAFDDG